jgi:PKD repeat protein
MVYIEEAITGLNADNDSPTALGGPTAFSASISTGTNVTYTWNLGDGQVKFGKNVVHTYSEAGEYSAVVTATNPVDQQVASTMVTVEIPISGLTAVNDSPTIVGNLTALTATITSGTNVSYFWAFSNGGTSIGQVATHLFDMVGIHSATVTATNSLGSQVAVTEIMIGEAVTLLEGTETYTTSDGTLNLQIPAPLTGTLTLTYTPQTIPSHAAGGFLFAGQSFQLSMMDENGDPILELDQPITLTLYYDESKLPVGTDEDQLSLQRYDTPTSSWVVLPVITRDTAADLIAVSLDHLSEFALFLEAQHRIYLPLVNR